MEENIIRSYEHITLPIHFVPRNWHGPVEIKVTIAMVQHLFVSEGSSMENQVPVAYLEIEEGSNLGEAYGESGIPLGNFAYRPWDPSLAHTDYLVIC